MIISSNTNVFGGPDILKKTLLHETAQKLDTNPTHGAAICQDMLTETGWKVVTEFPRVTQDVVYLPYDPKSQQLHSKCFCIST